MAVTLKSTRCLRAITEGLLKCPQQLWTMKRDTQRRSSLTRSPGKVLLFCACANLVVFLLTSASSRQRIVQYFVDDPGLEGYNAIGNISRTTYSGERPNLTDDISPNQKPSLSVGLTLTTEITTKPKLTTAPPQDTTQTPVPVRKSRIPRLIHQRWESYTLPAYFVDWVKSWTQQNPDWEYMFWTPADVDAFMRDKYPDMIRLYRHLPVDIERANVWRYLAMYHYGGLYADLDMTCLKPIEPWVEKHQCLFTQEPFEHNFLYKDNMENIINAFFLCSSHHPFFQKLIEALPGACRKYPNPDHRLERTGPFFVDGVLREYMQDPSTHNSSTGLDVSVAHPKYFQPMYDSALRGYLMRRCNERKANITKSQSSYYEMHLSKLCVDLEARNYSNIPSSDAYANHYWIHMNLEEKQWKEKSNVNIFDIVPNARTYRNLTKAEAQRESNAGRRLSMGNQFIGRLSSAITGLRHINQNRKDYIRKGTVFSPYIRS